MFVINDDNSIYATRGDIVFFNVAMKDKDTQEVIMFQPGDVLRIKIYGKKDAENVVLQKDFPVSEAAESVAIYLTEEDTKFGSVISKPTDYWYEVELNPYDNPQTIIGYDEDGAKVFKLFPEGDDIPEFVPDPEDIAIMDDELDMTSTRPVQNQAIARAMVSLRADFEKTNTLSTGTANALYVERARIDNLVASAAAPADADASYLELADVRVGADGVVYASAGTSVREQIAELYKEINDIAEKSVNLFNKNSPLLKKNYIVNAEGYRSLTGYTVTHPIKVQSGKVYKYTRGASLGSNVYYYQVDKNGNLLGSPLYATDEVEWLTFTATKSGYVAVNIGYTTLVDKFMFCEASLYPDVYTPFDRVFNLNVDASKISGNTKSLGENNRLYKKTIIWDGDSICAGKAYGDTTEANAWAGRIASANDMTYKNYAAGGGTITENMVNDSGVVRHSVSTTIDKMYNEFPNADYIILEGGTNDADLIGSVLSGSVPSRFGSFSLSDFSGNYNRETFCGALESTFYRATQYWKGKKIGYIVAQKMGRSARGFTADVNNRRAYFEAAMQICKKWGIPYLNLWDDCYLNPLIPHMHNGNMSATENVDAGSLYADGQHLTAAGYDFTASIVEAWLKTI